MRRNPRRQRMDARYASRIGTLLIIVSSTKLQIRSGANETPSSDHARSPRRVAMTEHAQSHVKVRRRRARSRAASADFQRRPGACCGAKPHPPRQALAGCLFPYFHLPLAGTLRRTCALLYDSSAPAARILGPRGEGERDDFPAHSRSCQFSPFPGYYSAAFFQTIRACRRYVGLAACDWGG